MAKDRTGRVNRRELLALGAAVGTAAVAEGFSPHDGLLGRPRGRYTDALPPETGDLSMEERVARTELANRQVTLR